MKIAQIAPPWICIPPRNYGGTESVIYNLVEQQVAQGHDVTLFAPGDAQTSARHVSFYPRSLTEEGVPWSMHLKAFYHLKKALEQVSEQDFDIVHTHLSCSGDMYIFPLTAALSTPHVTTLHSCFPFDRTPDGWIGTADSYYMDWAPKVPIVAISESARRHVSHPLNIVGVVHNGIETRQFCPLPLYQEREDFFVWLGRFVPEKGAHLAIEAAKRGGVPLILAGTVDTHVQTSVDYFKQMIEPQIDNKKIIYIGPVDMKQKLNLLRNAQGFLNPIEWEEPFGIVMIEAMMSYCPVISFARGAARELILHGITGFIVENLEEMIQAIPWIAELDREVAHTHAECNFSARRMAEKYTQIYQKIIDTSKVTAREPDKKSSIENRTSRAIEV